MAGGGGSGMCSKLTLSFVFRLVYTCTCICLCTPVFLSFLIGFVLNDFLFELVVRLLSQTIFSFSPAFIPPLCPASLPPGLLCSPTAIQFRQIPTGIQLKFLPNKQLSKALQTVCLQHSLHALSVISE